MKWLLERILPLANPDFNDDYSDVSKWWVEIDENGAPQRELGFDADGATIVAGPIANNHGFWTDSVMTFSTAEYPTVALDLFESAWARFGASYEQEHKRSTE